MFVTIAIAVSVLCFSAIHMLEMCAFIARYSGISSGYKAFGFTLNRSVMMLTRFFTMLLMPLLGFVVDMNIEKSQFLLMIHFSLFGAGVLSALVFVKQNKFKYVFNRVVFNYRAKGGLLKNILLVPFFYMKTSKVNNRYCRIVLIVRAVFYDPVSRYILFSSVFVYMIYALSVFIAFFAALNFYEYRASIG